MSKSWQDDLKGDSLSWLLEHESPDVRSLALRHLPPGDPALLEAARLAHSRGPVAAVLAEMNPQGYWVKPGAGYNPKYRSAVWALILLAQLGASAAVDERVATACAYMLENALTENGQFGYNGTPSGTIDCLQGNLCWALVTLGCDDPRLAQAYEWMARSVTGEGVAPASDRKAITRYYAYKCGPDFACGANYGQPCAWGAVKVMLAFGVCPAAYRTPLVERSIQRGVDFLFSVDPATAAYPSGVAERPSGNWWKFGFPVFYITDLLQLAEALAATGYARDPRLARTVEIIREKQDDQGRWALEYNYASKTWGNYGKKGQPNPWVTLRALRLLKAIA